MRKYQRRLQTIENRAPGGNQKRLLLHYHDGSHRLVEWQPVLKDPATIKKVTFAFGREGAWKFVGPGLTAEEYNQL